jgi:hypothetical protein
MTDAVSGATSTAKGQAKQRHGHDHADYQGLFLTERRPDIGERRASGPAMSMVRAPILSASQPKTFDKSPSPSVKGTVSNPLGPVPALEPQFLA